MLINTNKNTNKMVTVKHKDQRVGVFVDVANMYYSSRNLFGSRTNFGKVLEAAVAGRKLIRAIAYVVKAEAPEEAKFFEALDNQGFEVKTKNKATPTIINIPIINNIFLLILFMEMLHANDQLLLRRLRFGRLFLLCKVDHHLFV